MLLALDTATRHSGIALLDAHGAPVAELNWHSADGQTTELLPRLSQLLAWHAVEPAQLGAIAVGLGPGSFTGVRVALSAAKGMALAQGLPLIGIASLDATAYPFLRGSGTPVCAVVQAGRGRLCWAVYSNTADMLEPHASAARQASSSSEALRPTSLALSSIRLGEWSGRRTAYHLSDVGALAERITVPTRFVGEVDADTAQALQAALGEFAMLAGHAVSGRRAAVLAHLAWLRWQAGDSDDPASLSPIYLREP